jgi:hypothetical protein
MIIKAKDDSTAKVYDDIVKKTIESYDAKLVEMKGRYEKAEKGN